MDRVNVSDGFDCVLCGEPISMAIFDGINKRNKEGLMGAACYKCREDEGQTAMKHIKRLAIAMGFEERRTTEAFVVLKWIGKGKGE